jgi:hypothetical protein
VSLRHAVPPIHGSSICEGKLVEPEWLRHRFCHFDLGSIQIFPSSLDGLPLAHRTRNFLDAPAIGTPTIEGPRAVGESDFAIFAAGIII